MNSSRLFMFGAAILLSAAVFLSVIYSQDNAPQPTDEDMEMFQRLSHLHEAIENNYYTEPDSRTLFSGAMNGMLSDLDPHSSFIDVVDYEQYAEQYRGNYSGIGVSFVLIDEKITVVSVVEGGPSDQAGLQMGDLIVEIEGESAIGISNDEVQDRLRGQGGTKVTVGLERAGHDELVYTTITRGNIPIESVQNTMMLNRETGYVQMTRFARPTNVELEQAMELLSQNGMKQMVLDLRGNGGGLLGTAIAVTDKFLSGQRLIVYTDGQMDNAHQSYYSYKNGRDWEIPIIVLISHGSASASEIVAGALQDWDRGIIVGETSFGKGLVQNSYSLGDGSRLLLTTSHYFTPTGRLIQRPYKNVDLETYQMAGIDGNDSGAFDALEQPQETKPVYFTPSGRQVYGGGGITPDIVVENDLMFDPFVYSLANQFITFFYAREWTQANPKGDMDFNTFARNFTVTDEMLDGLLDKAMEREFVFYPRRGTKYSDEQVRSAFVELADDIRLYLKSEIAQFYYGREKGYTIRALSRDKVLAEAVKHFGAAEELADNYKKTDPGYFAATRTNDKD